MREVIIDARHKGYLMLGKEGENGALKVRFDVSDWGDYPGASFTLNAKRETDSSPYSVNVTRSGDYVDWTVSSSDVAVPGEGEVELVLAKGTTIFKSATFLTLSGESMAPSGTAPDPYASWYNTVLSNTNTAKNDAASALTKANTAVSTANSAETKANTAVSTANTAASTAQSATNTANQAITSAGSAVTTANNAASAASAASTAAGTAQTKANTADSKATLAQQTAEEAWLMAESAETKADTATANASTAVTTANAATTAVGTRSKVFNSQPVPPYKQGDIWVAIEELDEENPPILGDDSDESASGVFVCVTSKASGESFSEYDWRKVSGEDVAAEVEELKEDLASKLDKPTSGFAVGKVFKVLSENPDGTFVCGWADDNQTDVQINGTSIVSDGVANIPIAVKNQDENKYLIGKYNSGYGITTRSDGIIITQQATNVNIDQRTNQWRPITSNNLEYAVDSILCSSTASEALTSEQQNKALARLNAEPKHNDWELIESFAIENDSTIIPKNAEPNGTPYNFKRVRIEIATKGTQMQAFALGIIPNYSSGAYLDGNACFRRSIPSRSDGKYFFIIEIICENGVIEVSGRFVAGNDVQNPNYATVEKGCKWILADVINRFSIATYQENAIKAGTEIKIYAIRA